MLTCRVCGKQKSDSSFHVRVENGKRRTECKQCRRVYITQWNAKNVDKVREYSRRWGVKNYAEKTEEMRAYQNTWRAKNSDRARQRYKQWYADNKEIAQRATKAWARANLARVRQLHRERDKMLREATPTWLTAIQLAQIQEMYDVTVALETQTGIAHHVDHIHPLRGRNFRGLHVPWNLQVLTATDNMRKRNHLVVET